MTAVVTACRGLRAQEPRRRAPGATRGASRFVSTPCSRSRWRRSRCFRRSFFARPRTVPARPRLRRGGARVAVRGALRDLAAAADGAHVRDGSHPAAPGRGSDAAAAPTVRGSPCSTASTRWAPWSDRRGRVLAAAREREPGHAAGGGGIGSRDRGIPAPRAGAAGRARLGRDAGRSGERAPPPQPERSASRRGVWSARGHSSSPCSRRSNGRLVLAAFALSGALSMVYELGWTRRHSQRCSARRSTRSPSSSPRSWPVSVSARCSPALLQRLARTRSGAGGGAGRHRDRGAGGDGSCLHQHPGPVAGAARGARAQPTGDPRRRASGWWRWCCCRPPASGSCSRSRRALSTAPRRAAGTRSGNAYAINTVGTVHRRGRAQGSSCSRRWDRSAPWTPPRGRAWRWAPHSRCSPRAVACPHRDRRGDARAGRDRRPPRDAGVPICSAQLRCGEPAARHRPRPGPAALDRRPQVGPVPHAVAGRRAHRHGGGGDALGPAPAGDQRQGGRIERRSHRGAAGPDPDDARRLGATRAGDRLRLRTHHPSGCSRTRCRRWRLSRSRPRW